MVQSFPLALTAASLLLLPSALADGLYSKTSSVLQVDGSSYDNLIAKSNYTVSSQCLENEIGWVC
jgi:protein disulfide-isomerase A6